MLKLWKWYQNCLAVNPVKTQVISSGFLWGIGDIAAQCITHSTSKKRLQLAVTDEEFKINWKRVAITSMFGLGFVGPVGHFWYENLDKFIRLRLQLPPKSARFVATKVAMDSIIFGPLDLLVFFTYMGFSAGKNAAQVKADLKRDFLPALALEGGIWPIVQVANFRYVPVRYQLQYVNIFCLLDSAFLSWVEQQKDAPWKQWFNFFHSLEDRGGKGGL
ncbi:hypothetical protein ACOSP7_015375 [Xanthoceras sorbifolium]|uniref:PXMP2/4 family protein 2 n=1 Tax=Xanthoceras sorbifolium TaxID=99658 RepID=A0ABQ8I7G1_9ROSI|nr:hypothetical protein JRO89_XS04G0276500 [Xanthoceras sorbifolium]